MLEDPERLIAAKALAELVHHGQTDRAGVDYMQHVLHVADTADDGTTDTRIVGLLHDTIEDGYDPFTIAYLIHMMFGDRILAAVQAMTHRDNETYPEYVERVRANPLARTVKVADLRHNLDVTRLGLPADAPHPKAASYHAALARLKQ